MHSCCQSRTCVSSGWHRGAFLSHSTSSSHRYFPEAIQNCQRHEPWQTHTWPFLQLQSGPASYFWNWLAGQYSSLPSVCQKDQLGRQNEEHDPGWMRNSEVVLGEKSLLNVLHRSYVLTLIKRHLTCSAEVITYKSHGTCPKSAFPFVMNKSTASYEQV